MFDAGAFEATAFLMRPIYKFSGRGAARQTVDRSADAKAVNRSAGRGISRTARGKR